MNKPVVGILTGAALGAIDGAKAWFTPAVRDQLTFIMAASSVKGMLVGVLSGLIARKVRSNPIGVASGAAIGLLLAYIVAAMPEPNGQHYYLEIMLPGFVAGGIVGFLTQRLGQAPAAKSQGAKYA